MDLNLKILPLELEFLIKNYYYDLEHFSNFKKTLKEIKKIKYKIYVDFDNREIVAERIINKRICDIYLTYEDNNNFLQIETSLLNSKKSYKYWLFEDNKIIFVPG